jgi:transcriptional regulator with XRE-family HTH domain
MLATRKLFGARMRQLREEAGFRVEDVARLARVNRTHIHALERGAWWPSMDLLQELARIYRVDTTDFFVFPDKSLRDRGRELMRLVPNSSLASVIAAMEKAAGKTLQQLAPHGTTPAAAPTRKAH